DKDEEIKIGFVAGLSGKYSSLGISVRDGFRLAFEEVDYKIDGKKVTIFDKDDKQDENEAKKAIEFFIKNDIKLIVGNTTSSMTKVSTSLIEDYKDSLMVSATASSSYFTKKDDNFLRVQVDNSPKRYKSLAQTLLQSGYQDILCIYDSKNKAYTDDYTMTLENVFVEEGGNKYSAKIDINQPYEDILKKVKDTKKNLILVVGNAVDTANIIQYLRINNEKSKILGSGWAKTNDFITNGGEFVEGVIFSEGYDDESKNQQYLDFATKFKKRYNKEPSVFSTQGYELGKILIKNLEKSSDIALLKNNILSEKRYDGLQGDITFDKYGDVMREFFMMEVKNKKFIKANSQ
ncbi:MAG: ABC transporter substrate-binding protein, partial [Campylobacterota bacterium]|nr:ABC transporter substrate-binding protein [Campylobacterota bacterium]